MDRTKTWTKWTSNFKQPNFSDFTLDFLAPKYMDMNSNGPSQAQMTKDSVDQSKYISKFLLENHIDMAIF